MRELEGCAIGGVLGDQQAALFGQGAFREGEAKCTYGTGLFLMFNTGGEVRESGNGLLTTVAYQLGKPRGEDGEDADGGGETVYALEGSVAHSGSTMQWLRDQMGIIKNTKELKALATQTKSNDGLYFVPAFSGFFAPCWRAVSGLLLVWGPTYLL